MSLVWFIKKFRYGCESEFGNIKYRSRMKALKFCLDYLTLLGICSNRLYDSTNEFLRTINSYICLFGFLGPLLSFSAAYIYKNFSDLELSTNAMIVLAAGIASFGGWFTIGLKMKTVKLLYREIQDIVDAGVLVHVQRHNGHPRNSVLIPTFISRSRTYAIVQVLR